jgi:type VI protein secretion system component Hcp
MKNHLYNKKILFCLFLAVAVSSNAQQQFTHIAAKENISCNYDCTILDVTELNNNPVAVIFVTSISDKGVTINLHPIGAYYFKEKWHIFNLDSRPIPAGSKYTVIYFTNPDEKHFQYSFRREDIQADGSALIDHPSLNNNPSAKFSFFPRWDPNSPGGITNRDEIKTEYNAAAGKWSFSNKNQKPLFARVTYNISLEAAGNITSPHIVTDRVSLPIGQLGVPANPNPANPNNLITGIAAMYMAAWAGNTKLPGDNKQASFLEQTELLGVDMGTNNFSPRKNTYDPITIRLHSGTAMMIQLLNAYMSKQSMTFQIDAISNNTTGKYALNYTIKLTGAYISSYKQVFLLEPNQSGTGSPVKRIYDEIKVTFTQIQFTNSTSATATDNF